MKLNSIYQRVVIASNDKRGRKYWPPKLLPRPGPRLHILRPILITARILLSNVQNYRCLSLDKNITLKGVLPANICAPYRWRNYFLANMQLVFFYTKNLVCTRLTRYKFRFIRKMSNWRFRVTFWQPRQLVRSSVESSLSTS